MKKTPLIIMRLERKRNLQSKFINLQKYETGQS